MYISKHIKELKTILPLMTETEIVLSWLPNTKQGNRGHNKDVKLNNERKEQ